MPRVVAIDPLDPDPDVIAEAVEALQDGALVVLPTETVYGLCADPSRPDAVQAIYEVKGRDTGKPLALLASNLEQVRAAGARLNPAAERMAQAFWPGGLTLVLPVADTTIGFRVPDHQVPLRVLSALGGVMIATSANRSGQPEAATAQAAADDLGDRVELILDGGPMVGAVASTVVSVVGEKLDILREGGISRGQIEGAA